MASVMASVMASSATAIAGAKTKKRSPPQAPRLSTDLAAIAPLAVSVEQAAHMLGVHRATLYKLVMRHEIDSFTVGRARRIAIATLQQWISERSRDPT